MQLPINFLNPSILCRYLPRMCLQMAKGDLDFLKERNTCSACCLCSVLTMDGGAWKTKDNNHWDVCSVWELQLSTSLTDRPVWMRGVMVLSRFELQGVTNWKHLFISLFSWARQWTELGSWTDSKDSVHLKEPICQSHTEKVHTEQEPTFCGFLMGWSRHGSDFVYSASQVELRSCSYLLEEPLNHIKRGNNSE